MDGFGKNESTYGNAIAAAKKPNLDKIVSENPMTFIGASGLDVGLPDGQMGNSEVGHTNIGAGRVVYQSLPGSQSPFRTATFSPMKLSSAQWRTAKRIPRLFT